VRAEFLNGIHHSFPLRQERIAQFLGSFDLLAHHGESGPFFFSFSGPASGRVSGATDRM
jgi:hypothetical protein